MNANSHSRKVDIDSYFAQFSEDLKSTGKDSQIQADQPHLFLGLNKFMPALGEGGKPFLTAAVIPDPASDQRTKRDKLQLEAAHRTVFSLKQQLQQEPQPMPVEPLAASETDSEDGRKRHPAIFRVFSISMLCMLSTTALWLIASSHANLSCSNYRLCLQLQSTASEKMQSILQKQTRPSSIDNFHSAILASGFSKAKVAGEMTQTAKTAADWEAVTQQWQQAIDDLRRIPETSSVYEKAQERLPLYRKNLLYSQSEYDSFREAVNAAEAGSRLVQTAKTPEEWQAAVVQWQEALGLMQAVPQDSANYPIAQEKLAEYATKFAYVQSRYLEAR